MAAAKLQELLPGIASGDGPSGVHDELERVLAACMSELGAGLVALLMPGPGLDMHRLDPEPSFAQARDLLAELGADIDYWSQAAAKSIVVRNAKRRQARPRIACKLAVGRVPLGKRAQDGLLVFARPLDGADFGVADKALLRAAAKRTADVIRAHHDDLTGLVNRKQFEYLIDRLQRRAADSTVRHCVLHLDLDEVTQVESLFGREARDAAIRQIAAQLDRSAPDKRGLGRIGDDEFAILLEDCPLHRGIGIAQELRRTVGDLNIVVGDQTVKVTASVGVSQLLPGTGTPDSVLAAAKIACATAKGRGRDQVAAFRHDEAVRQSDRPRAEVVAQILTALEQDRFVLYSQLIRRISARTEARHFEILLRGFDADGELMTPGQFMPHAEQSQIMLEIDRWVIKNCFAMLDASGIFRQRPSTVFAINLSGQSLGEDGFLDFVIGELERSEVPPSSICFEVTETAAILNIERATKFMAALRAHGCLFSLDDFGAGLSSFSYLRRLPIDFLKIDGQFARDIVDDPVCEAIVAAINQMSHAMGVLTIAEYVASPAIRKRVAEVGTDYVQGESIAKARPLHEELEQLASRAGRGRRKRRSRAG